MGSHSLRKDGAWCLWTCFRDSIIFVTPSGERAYTKNFADHISSKKSREKWPYRIVFIEYFLVERTQVPNRKLLGLIGLFAMRKKLTKTSALPTS
jgi:hypothetical protein